MTRFTICDDEPEHGRLIGNYFLFEYAKHVPETDIAEVVVYQSPQEMLDEAIEDTDIFILDIECGKSSGLDIAKEIRRLNKNAGIVFCTSHSNYVYQVFGLTPIDFIRKNNIEKDIVTMADHEKYKNLDKLFISKSMFEMFSQKHGCELVFTSVENPYYWNSQFMYNVLIIKK